MVGTLFREDLTKKKGYEVSRGGAPRFSRQRWQPAVIAFFVPMGGYCPAGKRCGGAFTGLEERVRFCKLTVLGISQRCCRCFSFLVD